MKYTHYNWKCYDPYTKKFITMTLPIDQAPSTLRYSRIELVGGYYEESNQIQHHNKETYQV